MSNKSKTKQKKKSHKTAKKPGFLRFWELSATKDYIILLILAFLALGVGFVSGSYLNEQKTDSPDQLDPYVEHYESSPPEVDTSALPELYLPIPLDIIDRREKPDPEDILKDTEAVEEIYAEEEQASPAPVPVATQPYVRMVVIIDDVGVNVRESKKILSLPGPLTLSYLPYASHVQKQVEEAKQKGHELMLHMPMEPMDSTVGQGPKPLMVDYTAAQIRENVQWDLEQFKGYVGVNNHMGSRFTAYRPGMKIVMAEIKKQGVFYIDSMTSPNSVGLEVAADYGVAALPRDIFLDHIDDYDAVMKQLNKAVQRARKKGYAIAIGHPRENTYKALKTWLPTLEKQNIRLVKASSLFSGQTDD